MSVAERIVANINDLPTLPEVVARLNDLVYDPDASAGAMTDLISRDPALCTRLLKLVNSAYYGFDRKISSLTQTVVILGFNEVRSVALSASVIDAFRHRPEGFDYRAFWIHSVGAAVAASALASQTGCAGDEDGFVCGLLHDVGRLVLVAHGPRPYAEVLAKARDEKIPLHDAERALLETDHAEVGGSLLERWQLPVPVVDAVLHHHRPHEAGHAPELAALTHAAEYAVQALKIGADGDNHPPELNPEARRRLGFEDKSPEALLEIARAERPKVDAYIESMQWDNSDS